MTGSGPRELLAGLNTAACGCKAAELCVEGAGDGADKRDGSDCWLKFREPSALNGETGANSELPNVAPFGRLGVGLLALSLWPLWRESRPLFTTVAISVHHRKFFANLEV